GYEHAVEVSAGMEPAVGDPQSIAVLHQHVRIGHVQSLEYKLAVAAVHLLPHDRNAAQNAPAWLVAMIEKGGEPAPLILRRARDEDEMIGDAGAGDEPLVAVDHPTVALLLRTRADHAGIGAATGRRLRHRESGAHLPLDDRLDPFVLLRRRARAR